MAVARGANLAITECQHQFRNRRWNCSTKNFLRGKNIFGKIVDKGKQTSINSVYLSLCLCLVNTIKLSFLSKAWHLGSPIGINLAEKEKAQ